MRFLLLVFLGVLQWVSAAENPPTLSTPTPTFTANLGQIISSDHLPVPEIRFVAGQPGSMQAYFTPTRVSYVFPKIDMQPRPQLQHLPKEFPKRLDSMIPVITELHRMDVEFIGANPNAQMTGTDQASDYTNYYLAHCPQGITHVPSYAKLIVKDMYPKIDAVWKTTEHGLKYEFIVHPGGDYRQIRMRYSGADIAHTAGLITATTPLGSIRDESPVSFQNGSEIATQFIKNKDSYGFSVDEYDRTEPLVIDPMVVWGTYQIGPNNITGMRVDVDGNNVIMGGVTSSTFPASAGAFQTTFVVNPMSQLGRDCYVAKFNKEGIRQWGTYYGGTAFEPIGTQHSTNTLALDANNNIVFVGTTSEGTFPLQNAFQGTFGGNTDMFVVKLFADGSRDWATYYGGGSFDEAWGVTIDPSFNIIVVGWTQSTNFPTAGTVFQSTNANATGIGTVVKLSSTGGQLWATYFGKNTAGGGTNFNNINAVTTDNSGNIYFTGEAWGSGFPTTSGTFQPVNDTTFFKITVASLDAGGQRRWSTFHGCGIGNDIICDNNNLYVVGTTQSATLFNVTIGTYIISGIADVCIFSLGTGNGNRNGGSWSRLFGGTDATTWLYGRTDFGQSIAFGPDNDIWVGGLAGSSGNFPVINVATNPPWSYNIQQSHKGGTSDAFFARFSKTDGDVKYSTLFGSTGVEEAGYAFPYGSSNLFFGISSENPSTLPISTDRRIGTPYSVTIAKICTSYGVITDAGTDAVLCSGDTLQIGVAPINGSSYVWTSAALGDLSSPSIANPKAYPTNTGTTQYKVKYFLEQTDQSGCYGRFAQGSI